MKQKGILAALAAAVFFIALPLSASKKYKVVGGPEDFYFGHISFVEAKEGGNPPTILREGSSVPIPAILNAPVLPGDIIRTAADLRCEIQFDTGTLVRLDFGSELKLETVNAKNLSSYDGITNLVLNKGRIYVMFKRYDRGEVFQVLTENAAVKMKHNSVAMIGVPGPKATNLLVRNGKAYVLFGPEVSFLNHQTVRKNEQLIVDPDHKAVLAPAPSAEDFEKWNEGINASFPALHEGKSPLPKPIQDLPDAIFYFAQNFGNFYGEWIWDSLYGYIWRPYENNLRYPWGSWQPYIYGQWATAGGRDYWIPQEPWGWIPYHLGIWQWDKKLGWVWIPGSLFSSNWAAWDRNAFGMSWRPWGVFDGLGLYDYGYGYGWYDPSPSNPNPRRPEWTKIDKDQLKKKSDSSDLPLSKELKKVCANVYSALKKGDPRVLDSLRSQPSRPAFMSGRGKSGLEPRERIPFGVDKNPVHVPAGIPEKTAGTVSAPAPKAGLPDDRTSPIGLRHGRTGIPAAIEIGRFRDWNPDVKIAARLGVSINYSSARNEISCPELRISSKDIDRAGVQLGNNGVVSSFGGSSSGGGSNDSGSSADRGSSSTDRGSARGDAGRGVPSGGRKN